MATMAANPMAAGEAGAAPVTVVTGRNTADGAVNQTDGEIADGGHLIIAAAGGAEADGIKPPKNPKN